MSRARTRNLRADATMVEMMAECSKPFSLLGKLQTYDFDHPDEELFVVNRPILVMSDAKNIEHILEWEKANTIYEKEVRLMDLFPMQKRINQQRYFSQ